MQTFYKFPQFYSKIHNKIYNEITSIYLSLNLVQWILYYKQGKRNTSFNYRNLLDLEIYLIMQPRKELFMSHTDFCYLKLFFSKICFWYSQLSHSFYLKQIFSISIRHNVYICFEVVYTTGLSVVPFKFQFHYHR